MPGGDSPRRADARLGSMPQLPRMYYNSQIEAVNATVVKGYIKPQQHFFAIRYSITNSTQQQAAAASFSNNSNSIATQRAAVTALCMYA